MLIKKEITKNASRPHKPQQIYWYNNEGIRMITP